MKAQFWWALRDWWHYPQFWHATACSPFPWYRIMWAWKYPSMRTQILKAIPRELKWWIRQRYWDLRYLQPFRCNGDGGGWRTRVCDWLEEKARSYEEHDA